MGNGPSTTTKHQKEYVRIFEMDDTVLKQGSRPAGWVFGRAALGRQLRHRETLKWGRSPTKTIKHEYSRTKA